LLEAAHAKALKTFGKTIKDLRNNLGFTQDQLAEKAGFHPVYISQLERGTKAPSLECVLKLADALETSPGEILNLAFLPKGKSSDIKRQIIMMIVQQNEKDLLVLRAIVKSYIDVIRTISPSVVKRMKVEV
jgi:transcriptional regulator with XRE-family HTH domain